MALISIKFIEWGEGKDQWGRGEPWNEHEKIYIPVSEIKYILETGDKVSLYCHNLRGRFLLKKEELQRVLRQCFLLWKKENEKFKPKGGGSALLPHQYDEKRKKGSGSDYFGFGFNDFGGEIRDW